MPFVLAVATSTTARRHHVAAALGRARRPAAPRSRALAAHAAHAARGRARCSSTSTPRADDAADLDARCVRRRRTCPPRCARVVFVRRPTAAGHAVERATLHARDGRRRAGRGPRPARAASDDGRAAGPVAAVELRARAAPVGRRRLPVPRASRARTSATSGWSRSPRCATSRRCATTSGRVVALPELERMRARRSRRCARSSRARPPRERLLWNRAAALRVADDRASSPTRRAR